MTAQNHNPPRLAVALLDGLQVSAPLAGDLLEEYRSGRSRGWYWGQVLAAVVVAWNRHKLLTFKGFVSAAALYHLTGYPASRFLGFLDLWFSPHVPLWFAERNLHLQIGWAAVGMFMVFCLLGAAITVLNPRHQVPTLVLFIAYVTILDVWNTASFVGTHGAPGFVILWWHVPNCAAHILGTLTGGLARFRPSPNATRSQS
jgi:hypothetical protein